MSSIKKGQTSITSFFSNVNSNNKRSLSERDSSTDNKTENKVVIQEYKSNKTITNSSDNFSTISTKKKKIIDDEEYYDNYSSLIPKADVSKQENGNNDKDFDNNNLISGGNEIEMYKNTEEIPSVKKNFRNSTNISSNQDTPSFMKKSISETPSHLDPALKKNIEKNKGKTTGNKKKLFDKEEDSESENSNSQVSTSSNNQNRSPEDNLPEFLKYENIKDMNGKRPEDPDYDPTTLLVPDSFLKKQTQTQQQFWTFKMHNFDKVLFFKLGKFYELFFDDAIIGNKVLELNWMGSDPKKLHVGFPEKNLEEKAAILVEQGFKVAVIEQVETPEEMEERNKKNKTKDKNLRRDLCNVFTKGTFSLTSNSQSSQNSVVYSNKYCIAIVNYNPKDLEILEPEKEKKMFFGFVLFDVSTLNFYVGEIEEDDTYNKIQSIFFTIKPEEVIYFRNNLPLFIENFIKSLSSKPLITVRKNDFNLMKSYHLVTEHFGSDQDNWDPLINKFILDKRYSNISAAFYLSINFLKNLLLSETVKVSKFYEYEEGIISKSSLIMDYQAIFNLELLETNLDPKKPESGSFVEFMNRCCTGFGKREMKKWLLNPLTNVDEIYSRLEIVEDFSGNYDLLTRFRNSLSKLPDFEKTCGRIYKSATQRSSKAVYFEDISKHKLNEFFKLLESFKSSTSIFKIFDEFKDTIKSKKLKKMIMKEDETFIDGNSEEVIKGRVPDINIIVDEFQNIFKYKKLEKETIIEPEEGVDEEYDNFNSRVKELEQELSNVLDQEKKKFKCNLISFAHTKFYRYELEIPEEIVSGDKRPKNYKLTTNKKGFLRFHTAEIEKLVSQLEEAENNLKNALKNINTAIFKRFYTKHQVISEYIKVLAELDCYANLAIISSQSDGVMSRPEFIRSNESPYLLLEKMRHPILSSTLINFVPNDTIIGYPDNNEIKTSILITGPNMGGKSTILRQTCVAVIMAQIGCYVPAEKCQLTVVDRIFTRIGARDRILEGKSTFFIEMEETKTIIDYATSNSLVIIDELGRGTSTNEGMVIAKNVLDYVTNKIKCRMLFTTHYHDLVDKCKIFKGVDLFHMDCFVDDKNHSVNFLYKFKKGVCPKSYGINVAKLAGIKYIKEGLRGCRKVQNIEKGLVKLLVKMEFSIYLQNFFLKLILKIPSFNIFKGKK